VLWPDFTRRDLIAAVAEFARRERRYGGVVEASVVEAGVGEGAGDE